MMSKRLQTACGKRSSGTAGRCQRGVENRRPPKRDSAIGEDSGGADGDDLVIGHVVHKSAR